MYRQIIHEASAEQLEAVHRMTDQAAQRVNSMLATAYEPARAYYPNTGLRYRDLRLADDTGLDLGRAATELALQITETPNIDESWVLGPYCIEGATMLRGIAVWQRQLDIPRIASSGYMSKAERLVNR